MGTPPHRPPHSGSRYQLISLSCASFLGRKVRRSHVFRPHISGFPYDPSLLAALVFPLICIPPGPVIEVLGLTPFPCFSRHVFLSIYRYSLDTSPHGHCVVVHQPVLCQSLPPMIQPIPLDCFSLFPPTFLFLNPIPTPQSSEQTRLFPTTINRLPLNFYLPPLPVFF